MRNKPSPTRSTSQLFMAVGLLLLAFSACGPAVEPTPPDQVVTDPARVTVMASTDDDIVSVVASVVQVGDMGVMAHWVEVTWHGQGRAVLDDARLTHAVAGDGGGQLVIAGRGCGAQWDPQRQQVMHPCTMDLRIIQLGPGQAHEYPVQIHPAVGPLRLLPGTYEVAETIGWQSGVEEGRFTITLTYVVE